MKLPPQTLLWAVLLSATQAREITVKNSCGIAVYAAYAGKGGQPTVGGSPAPGGWEIQEGGQTVLDVPEGWYDARIWIRSGGCNGDVEKCQIGKCKSGGLLCDGTEYGTLGPTVAEFNIKDQDFYDVSMVEGFTIPMTITPSDSSCDVGSCGVDEDLLSKCDPRLALPQGGNQVWGCASACTNQLQFVALAGQTFDPKNSPSCCTGQWADDKCTHDIIPFYNAVKPLCKNGYVYAKDDTPFGSTQSAVWSCSSKPSYTLELCSSSTSGVQDSTVLLASAGNMDPGPGGALNVAGGGSSSGTTQPATSAAPGPTTQETTQGDSTSALPTSVVTTSTDQAKGTLLPSTSASSSSSGMDWGYHPDQMSTPVVSPLSSVVTASSEQVEAEMLLWTSASSVSVTDWGYHPDQSSTAVGSPVNAVEVTVTATVATVTKQGWGGGWQGRDGDVAAVQVESGSSSSSETGSGITHIAPGATGTACPLRKKRSVRKMRLVK